MTTSAKDTMAQLRQEIYDDINTRIDKTLRDLKRETPKKTGAASRNWKAEKYTGQGEIVIENDLPYVERLNEGWSSQAPAGYVDAILQKNFK